MLIGSYFDENENLENFSSVFAPHEMYNIYIVKGYKKSSKKLCETNINFTSVFSFKVLFSLPHFYINFFFAFPLNAVPKKVCFYLLYFRIQDLTLELAVLKEKERIVIKEENEKKKKEANER